VRPEKHVFGGLSASVEGGCSGTATRTGVAVGEAVLTGPGDSGVGSTGATGGLVAGVTSTGADMGERVAETENAELQELTSLQQSL